MKRYFMTVFLGTMLSVTAFAANGGKGVLGEKPLADVGGPSTATGRPSSTARLVRCNTVPQTKPFSRYQVDLVPVGDGIHYRAKVFESHVNPGGMSSQAVMAVGTFLVNRSYLLTTVPGPKGGTSSIPQYGSVDGAFSLKDGKLTIKTNGKVISSQVTCQ